MRVAIDARVSTLSYPTSVVDTPSLNPSRSLNWNMRAPHGRSAGSLSNAPPAAETRSGAIQGLASRSPALLVRPGSSSQLKTRRLRRI